MTGLRSLVATGTKLWLDSIDPDLTPDARNLGASGATSNPIIVSDIIKSGRFDAEIAEHFERGLDDEAVAWAMTDRLVSQAQGVFADVYKQTGGNDGYVSFELDPLLEDVDCELSHADRVAQYVELGKKWSASQTNRMIKVPATAAGLDALEDLAAAGVTLNVTLIFSDRQYQTARENVWRGAQRRRDGLTNFKSVYSIFISRVDVYTTKHVPELSDQAQGQVGLVNVKRMWQSNQQWWASHKLPLQQEIIFASTGAKLEGQAPDFYVQALAGSDIQTNPPATNDMIEKLDKSYSRQIDRMPDQAVLDEIDHKVDQQKMENTLMAEGTAKFADPFKELLKLIAEKREALAGA